VNCDLAAPPVILPITSLQQFDRGRQCVFVNRLVVSVVVKVVCFPVERQSGIHLTTTNMTVGTVAYAAPPPNS
jgi:hypothetical protein